MCLTFASTENINIITAHDVNDVNMASPQSKLSEKSCMRL